MIVKCPSCGVRLLAQRSIFGERKRKAKCVKCGTNLAVGPLPPLTGKSDTHKSQPDSGPKQPLNYRNSPPNTFLRPTRSHKHLWAVTALCFLTICIIAPHFEIGSAIYSKFWESQDVPPSNALKIQNLTLSWVTRGGSIELAIKGDLVNFSNKTLKSQNLTITLLDKIDSPLLAWEHEIPVRFIQPQQYLAFKTTVDEPPKEAVAALVTLGSSSISEY